MVHIELGRQFNEGKILNAKKVASFISRYGRRFMALPGSIILIAVAIAIFRALASPRLHGGFSNARLLHYPSD